MVLQLDKGKGDQKWKENMQNKIKEWEQMMNNVGVNTENSQEDEVAEQIPQSNLLKKKSQV